jgi:hypothetical protein
MTLIPLSAAALAVGIVNPGTTFTRNFLVGAGAAALFGTGTLLIDRRRDAVYYAGAKSLYCLRLAIIPLEVTDADLAKIERDVEDLRLQLGNAAAAGVDSTLLDQASATFASGRALAGEIRDASARFSVEIDKININVNAEIAKTDSDVSQIANMVAGLQKFATSFVPKYPVEKAPGTTESLRLAPQTSSAEANLRRSMSLVSAWVTAYQSAVAASSAKMRAENCTPSPPAGSAAEAPTIIVAGNQPVTVTGPSGTPTVITPIPSPSPRLPPPPRIVLPRQSAPIPVDPGDPLVDLSDNSKNSVFRQVIKRFNLPFQRASSFKSPLFINTVKRFQHCINARETGALTTSQLQKVLTTPNPTKCPLEEPRAGTATPAAPSTPLSGSTPAATTPAGTTTAPPATSPTAPTPLIPSPPDLGGR